MNSSKLEAIFDAIVKELSALSTVVEIDVFGSQQRKYSENSDLDISIFCTNSSQYLEIQEKLFEIRTKYRKLIHPVILVGRKQDIGENKYMQKNVLDDSTCIYIKSVDLTMGN